MSVIIQRRDRYSDFISDSILESPDTIPATFPKVSDFKSEPCPI